jgi:membrane-bound lytic murein transglycosylase D
LPLTLSAQAPPAAIAPAASAPAIATAPELFPRPAELQPDINFWLRVYTQISTTEGFVHDQRNLAVVYEKLNYPVDTAPKERQARIDAVRERYRVILKYLATGASARDAEEQRVRDLWPATVGAERLAQAADEVRFQLGQSDRFRAGLARAGAWEAHIAATIAAQGLPPELAALPHVESSFDPDAYSKVGAAGLWQFMRSTGKRYLRIDAAVDERMDPFRATEAAAQLLAYNYRVLGTWPLAITAYNHGAEGMRRARDKLGTSDIVTILRDYNSPLFGFASRNFYVSFLAAQAIDREPQKYFGAIQTQTRQQFQEVALPEASTITAIEKVAGVPRATLRAINPALREPIWSGSRMVPAGYRLRLPAGNTRWSASLLASRLQAPEVRAAVARVPTPVTTTVITAVATVSVVAAKPVASTPVLDSSAELAATNPDATDLAVADNGTIVVAGAETLGHYADWLGLTAARLRTLNNMSFRTPLSIGRRLTLDYSKVDRATFELRRRDFRDRLQADYFASRRIIGTSNYPTRRGDSLWSVTLRSPGVPSWLLQQYNPDVDFNSLRAGTILVLPRVENAP